MELGEVNAPKLKLYNVWGWIKWKLLKFDKHCQYVDLIIAVRVQLHCTTLYLLGVVAFYTDTIQELFTSCCVFWVRVSVSWWQWPHHVLNMGLDVYWCPVLMPVLARHFVWRIPYATSDTKHALPVPVGLTTALVTGKAGMALVLLGRCLCGFNYNMKSIWNQWHWERIKSAGGSCYSFNYWEGLYPGGCIRHVSKDKWGNPKDISYLAWSPLAGSPGWWCLSFKRCDNSRYHHWWSLQIQHRIFVSVRSSRHFIENKAEQNADRTKLSNTVLFLPSCAFFPTAATIWKVHDLGDLCTLEAICNNKYWGQILCTDTTYTMSLRPNKEPFEIWLMTTKK